MINTVIFDIGKVLVDYDWDDYLMKLFNDRDKVDRLKITLFKYNIWDEVDRGVWTEEEILDAYCRISPDLKDEIKLFWDELGKLVTQYDFTKDWLIDLKRRGYRVLFLSNWSVYLRDKTGEALDFIPLMDGGIFSCDVKLIKPEHRIYETIIEKYDLEPSKCVFLDDKEENIRAARECGLNGIVVRSHEEAVIELEEWLAPGNQFTRTQALIGKNAMNALKNSRVAVFGVGGVGGYVCEALVRSGIGAFDLIDSDRVSVTNLNRQIIALRSTIGKYKTEVMKNRMQDINPDVDVRIHNCFFLPENADDFQFNEYDYIVDAVDTVTAKIELITRAKAAGIPIISAMGAGNKLQPDRFKVADIYDTSICPLAKVMRRELKRRGVKTLKVVYSEETPVALVESLILNPTGITEETKARRSVPGSIAFSPSTMGLIIASEVVKDIIEVTE